jgi:hypothetical protein
MRHDGPLSCYDGPLSQNVDVILIASSKLVSGLQMSKAIGRRRRQILIVLFFNSFRSAVPCVETAQPRLEGLSLPTLALENILHLVLPISLN